MNIEHERGSKKYNNFSLISYGLPDSASAMPNYQNKVSAFGSMIAMAIRVVKFSSGGYKIRKIFA